MFADRLHRAMKGMGTDKGTLIRILSSRSEIDLFDIVESYKRQFQQTLFSKIYSETFGDFRKLVLELFGDSEFDPEKDAKKLRKAMKGAGTNEAIINKIIAGRSLAQRQAILEAYNAMYKRDLLKDFHDELSGFYREMIMALMTDPSEFAAKEVKRAVQGIGTDDRSLIELICSRTGAELRPIKEAYERLYSTTMADDVRSDTSGDYRELLLALIQNERNDSERVGILSFSWGGGKFIFLAIYPHPPISIPAQRQAGARAGLAAVQGGRGATGHRRARVYRRSQPAQLRHAGRGL